MTGRRPGAQPAAAALAALLALAAVAAASGAAAPGAPPTTPRASAVAPAPAGEAPARLADGPSLDVRLAPGPHTVGDRVEAVLTLRAPAGAGEPVFPEWSGAWGEAEVVGAGPVERVPEEQAAGGGSGEAAGTGGAGATAETANGAVGAPQAVYRQRLELTAFRPGEVPLPPVRVALPASPAAGGEGEAVVLTTPAGLALTIDSVLPAAAGPDAEAGAEAAEPAPMPPAPPRPLPLGAPFLLGRRGRPRRLPPGDRLGAPPRRAPPPQPAGAAGRGAVRGAARRGRRRARRSFAGGRSHPAEPRPAPLSRPRARLPGGRVHRPPRSAAASPPAACRPICRGARSALLAACDLVKFARRPATAEELAGHADSALALAGDLEAWLQPPVAPGGAAESAGRRRHDRAAPLDAAAGRLDPRRPRRRRGAAPRFAGLAAGHSWRCRSSPGGTTGAPISGR